MMRRIHEPPVSGTKSRDKQGKSAMLKLAETTNDGDPALADLSRAFNAHKAAFAVDFNPSRSARESRLDQLASAFSQNEEKIVSAVSKDFGHRARMETMFGEIVATTGGLSMARKNVGKWMKRRRVPTPLHMRPGHSYIVPQALGVVGIIAPWNYPFFLALSPLAPAIAAGNRVMIKPSELTPHSSALLEKIIAEAFPDGEVSVHTGDVELGAAFASLPFDHLLFTGSTAVGRKVSVAAAQNLTPVTLELGGKSPAIIDRSANFEKAARSIVFGKAFNAGQTCVAPDYVLAPRENLDAVVSALRKAFECMYPEIIDTPDYSSIVSDRHFDRLKNLIKDAASNGATVMVLGDNASLEKRRKLALTLVIDPSRELALMQEEIFGPILPIVPYDSAKGAIDYVNAGDRPLALYWFGDDADRKSQILSSTVAGGVTINDTNWHVVQENLPFGGVGASGQGAYHGAAGFETFSHMKPVFEQSRFTNTKMLQPPYSPQTEKILNLLRRFI